MKTRAFILGLILLAVAGIQANAECTNGTTQKTVNMTINNCIYAVEFCVYCNNNGGPRPSEVIVMGADKLGSSHQTWNFQQVLNEITSQATSYEFLSSILCNGISIPPCPTESETLSITKSLCWQITKVSYFGVDHILYKPSTDCSSEAKCVETFTYCFNTQDGTYLKIPKTATLVGPPLDANCSKEAQDATPPDEYNKPGTCFHVDCN